jgi:nucleoid DNA-binding protein
MLKITKRTLAAEISSALGFTAESQGYEIATALIEVLRDTLLDLTHIRIAKVGRLNISHKAARMGRNPQSGTPHEISERYSVTMASGRGNKLFGAVGKSELAKRLVVAAEGILTQLQANAVVGIFTRTIQSILDTGATAEFRGLGAFYLRTIPASIKRRNPKTGVSVSTAEAYYVKFRCSKELSASMSAKLPA